MTKRYCFMCGVSKPILQGDGMYYHGKSRCKSKNWVGEVIWRNGAYHKDEKKMTLEKIIEELAELQEQANYRAHLITENGRDITDVDRARSAAYADAYDFCILRLKDLMESKR